MNEVQQELLDITGTWISLVTICKTAHQLGLTSQKMKKIAIRRSELLRAKYMAVNGDIFLQFVQRCLLNIIQPFDGNNAHSVVVMDNASIHHVDAVVELITAAGALVQFLPPYRVRT